MSSTSVPSRRGGPRAEKLAGATQKEVGSNIHLPSPSSPQSVADAQCTPRKRKHSDNTTSDDECRQPKRQQVGQEATSDDECRQPKRQQVGQEATSDDECTQPKRRQVGQEATSDDEYTPRKRKHRDNTTSDDECRQPKRQQVGQEATSDDECTQPKRRQVGQEATESSPLSNFPIASNCPIAHWVDTFYWPEFEAQDPSKMSLPDSKKRKSSTSHYSERQRQLEQNGISLKISAPHLQKESMELCLTLLKGDLRPDDDEFPCYPAGKVPDILDRIQILNEARLQRDVTPWVVPSAENLIFSGKLAHRYIGEEVQAEWIRCDTLGGKKPKPDFCVGLQRSAFDDSEWVKLDNCITSSKPFYCTPNLWFPFLICEAKTERAALEAADMQNIHSGSIAVRSILRVCTLAYGRHDQRVKDLFGRILVFTVSHNNQQVNIYGHYAMAKDPVAKDAVAKDAVAKDAVAVAKDAVAKDAVAVAKDAVAVAKDAVAKDAVAKDAVAKDDNNQDENFEFFRCGIGMFSLGVFGDKQRYEAYNFVRNVYETFAPAHRDRLRDAIAALPKPGPRTGLSFCASELTIDEEEGSLPGTQPEAVFKTPSEPASAATRRQLDMLSQQLKQQRKESKEEKERVERERKEERKQVERQIERLMEQLEQQRKDSKEERERVERERKEEKEQMERERKEERKQMERLMAMLSTFQGAKNLS